MSVQRRLTHRDVPCPNCGETNGIEALELHEDADIGGGVIGEDWLCECERCNCQFMLETEEIVSEGLDIEGKLNY